MSLVLLALVLSVSIVAISFALVFALRRLIGHEWLARLGFGIGQFRGFRPIWIHDQLPKIRAAGVGIEGLRHARATAINDFEECEAGLWRGRASAQGASWWAESQSPVLRDQKLEIVAISGLTLTVKPTDAPGGGR